MISAFMARSFATAVREAMNAAEALGDSVLLIHDDVAVQVDPQDDEHVISANYDATVSGMRAKWAEMPLLSEPGRQVGEGDLVETLTDDHYTRIMSGSFGLVTHVEDAGTQTGGIVVRFARRTVDYEPADFRTLRYAR